jgi:predicted GNAT family acetyltransferase
MPTSPQTTVGERFEVRLNTTDHRYELWRGGHLVSIADVVRSDGVLTISRVETHTSHRGQSFAAMLMDGLVDDARGTRLTIRSQCWYATNYMRERPDTHDLFAPREHT